MTTSVLRITVEAIPEDLAGKVTLDVLNSLLGMHGAVSKLAVLPQPDSASVEAWAQFPDHQTAEQARAAVDGQPIPGHLLEDHASPPAVAARFAPQQSLDITVQSTLTRDFTSTDLPAGEPNLAALQALLAEPAAAAAEPPAEAQPAVPAPEQPAGRIIRITFKDAAYPVTVDGLHTVMATYGTVAKLQVLDEDGSPAALVQYSDAAMATAARTALQGHAMYGDGKNVMQVALSDKAELSFEPSAQSVDYTLQGAGKPAVAAPPARAATYHHDGPPGGRSPGGARPSYGMGQPGLLNLTGEDYVRAHERAMGSSGGPSRRPDRGPPPPAYGGYDPYAGYGGYGGPPVGGYGGYPGGGYPGGYGGPPPVYGYDPAAYAAAYPGGYPPQGGQPGGYPPQGGQPGYPPAGGAPPEQPPGGGGY